jgi:hypothetical protein
MIRAGVAVAVNTSVATKELKVAFSLESSALCALFLKTLASLHMHSLVFPHVTMNHV